MPVVPALFGAAQLHTPAAFNRVDQPEDATLCLLSYARTWSGRPGSNRQPSLSFVHTSLIWRSAADAELRARV
jgi:hypothetical protein